MVGILWHLCFANIDRPGQNFELALKTLQISENRKETECRQEVVKSKSKTDFRMFTTTQSNKRLESCEPAILADLHIC